MSRFRTQVSLLVPDEELHTEFIQPLSNSRQLMPLIVRLLSSYYYNDETKQLVDGYTVEDMKLRSGQETEEQKELRNSIEQLKSSMSLMGMFIEESKYTLEDGIEAINEAAKATGGSPKEDTGFGVSVPLISNEGIRKFSEGNVVVDDSERLSIIEDDVKNVKADLSEILSMLKNGLVSPTSVQNTDIKTIDNSVMEISKPQASTTTLSKVVEIVQEKKDIETKPTESSDSDTVSGFNMLKGLVSSGGIGGFLD